jgi:hypothetical protein
MYTHWNDYDVELNLNASLSWLPRFSCGSCSLPYQTQLLLDLPRRVLPRAVYEY